MNFFEPFTQGAAPRLLHRAPTCTLIREIAREETDLEITLPSLAAAAAQHLEVIDIRTPPKWRGARGRAATSPCPPCSRIQANVA